MESPNKKSVLFAFSSVDRWPWNKIFDDGTRETWLRQISDSNGVWLIQGRTPGRFFLLLDAFTEHLRWNCGRVVSYFLAYTLMITLLPFRLFVPKLYGGSFLYDGNKAPYRLFQFRFPESLISLRWKKIAIAREFLDCTSFDFLVLVNPSTYVHLSNLQSFLECIEEQKCQREIYSGLTLRSADSEFVVGSFIILNREAARKLVNGRWRIPVHTLDDVAIGEFFHQEKILPISCPTLLVETVADLEQIRKGVPDRIVNYKIKSKDTNRALGDVDLLKKVEELLIL
jgi:hypothetical protein